MSLANFLIHLFRHGRLNGLSGKSFTAALQLLLAFSLISTKNNQGGKKSSLIKSPWLDIVAKRTFFFPSPFGYVGTIKVLDGQGLNLKH